MVTLLTTFTYELAGFTLDYLVLIWTFIFGFSLIWQSYKKENEVTRQYNLGLGLFFMATAFSAFLYLTDLSHRTFIGGRIFPAKSEYENMGYVFDSINIQLYFIILFAAILISLAFLFYPLEIHLLNRKKPILSRLSAILSPVPIIARILELILLPKEGTTEYYFITGLYLLVYIMIGVSIFLLLYIYIRLAIKTPGEMRRRSLEITIAILIWIIVIFSRSTLLKNIVDAPYTFWLLPALEIVVLLLFVDGFNPSLQIEHLQSENYLYKNPVFQITIIGIISWAAMFFSILFWNTDLYYSQYWVAQAATNPTLNNFGEFMARSAFEGDGFGGQDLSYILIVISLLLYLSTIIPPLQEKLSKIKPYTGLIFASAVVLGLINRILKGFIARVRPGAANQFDPEYGKVLHYTPMWTFGDYDLGDAFSHGSFTSGHTTTAAILIVLGYIVIKTHKSWIISLVFAATVGYSIAMGFGRVVAGAHYPGDTVWAIITSIIALNWVYFDVLKIPEQEEGTLKFKSKFAEFNWSIAFVFFAIFVFAALLGIKFTFLDFEWYWPAAFVIGSLFAWLCWKWMKKTLTPVDLIK